MLRSALPLSVALAALCCGDALAGRTTDEVAGEARALAFSGDGLLVAAQSDGLSIFRLAREPHAQQLLYFPDLRDDDDAVALAGSAQASAISVQPAGGDASGPSRVFVGPPAGPLREVSTCAAGLLTPPVAVAGARIAWRDGACAQPAERPSAVGDAALMLGSPDPAAAPRRLALEPGVLPGSIALTPDGGLIGLLRPSFFAVDSEVRTFGAAGVGAAVAFDRGRVMTPLGVLPDGSRVFSLALLDPDEDPAACPSSIVAIPAGVAERRELAVGHCPLGTDAPAGPAMPRIGGDRVFALVGEEVQRDDGERPPRVSLVSVRGDGGDRRVHASGTHRQPLGLAADGDRVAYWLKRCQGTSSDITVVDGAAQDAGPAAIPACAITVRTRRARVRRGRIEVTLSCPLGCRGAAFDAGDRRGRRLKAFAEPPGSFEVGLTLRKAVRRGGRLRLRVAIDGGAARSAVIRLRR